MQKRDVVMLAVTHRRPPYVPWDIAFTPAAWRRLDAHLGEPDLERFVGNHFVYVNSTVGAFADQPDGRVRDGFGVLWRRADDGEVGMIEGQVLPEPTLTGFAFPDARDPRHYAHIPELIDGHRDRFRLLQPMDVLLGNVRIVGYLERVVQERHRPQLLHGSLQVLFAGDLRHLGDEPVPELRRVRRCTRRLLRCCRSPGSSGRGTGQVGVCRGRFGGRL